MAFCFYRNRKKYSILNRNRFKYNDNLNNDIIEDINLSNRKVTFSKDVKVHFIPRVKSQNSLIRELLWYNYEELNKFYKDKKRELIINDLKEKEFTFCKKITQFNKKAKSDFNIKCNLCDSINKLRSHSI